MSFKKEFLFVLSTLLLLFLTEFLVFSNSYIYPVRESHQLQLVAFSNKVYRRIRTEQIEVEFFKNPRIQKMISALFEIVTITLEPEIREKTLQVLKELLPLDLKDQYQSGKLTLQELQEELQTRFKIEITDAWSFLYGSGENLPGASLGIARNALNIIQEQMDEEFTVTAKKNIIERMLKKTELNLRLEQITKSIQNDRPIGDTNLYHLISGITNIVEETLGLEVDISVSDTVRILKSNLERVRVLPLLGGRKFLDTGRIDITEGRVLTIFSTESLYSLVLIIDNAIRASEKTDLEIAQESGLTPLQISLIRRGLTLPKKNYMQGLIWSLDLDYDEVLDLYRKASHEWRILSWFWKIEMGLDEMKDIEFKNILNQESNEANELFDILENKTESYTTKISVQMKVYSTFINTLRDSLRESEFSQTEIAEKIGISNDYLGSILMGATLPDKETLFSIAAITDLPSDMVSRMTEHIALWGKIIKNLRVIETELDYLKETAKRILAISLLPYVNWFFSTSDYKYTVKDEVLTRESVMPKIIVNYHARRLKKALNFLLSRADPDLKFLLSPMLDLLFKKVER